ncbi:hypothetical protein B0H10DRAFT_2186743 [Mycena sp. CBHHK59/15]|nr:hypothetical protein B0H10DRAFT_2202744 [Mycena sp. CBHHK59/15]KAJ6624159.1 hypothetical protein B0H10DRAFT_2186743 [Mycena sp. CBHHK59/15]
MEKGDLGDEAWARGSHAVDQDKKIREIHHWKVRMAQGSIIYAVFGASGSVLHYYGIVYPDDSCSELDQQEDPNYARQECETVCGGIDDANVCLKAVWKRDTGRMPSSESPRDSFVYKELSYRSQLAEIQNMYKTVDCVATTNDRPVRAKSSRRAENVVDDALTRLRVLPMMSEIDG